MSMDEALRMYVREHGRLPSETEGLTVLGPYFPNYPQPYRDAWGTELRYPTTKGNVRHLKRKPLTDTGECVKLCVEVDNGHESST
jgi:hypothetical protein